MKKITPGKFIRISAALLAIAVFCPITAQPAADSYPVKIAVIADVQYRSGHNLLVWRNYPATLKNFRAVLPQLETSGAVLLIELGDLIEDSDQEREDADYSMLDSEMRALKIPVRHVAGNNDQWAARRRLASLGWGDSLFYRFRLPELPEWLFVVLNTSENARESIGQPQLQWLKAVLREAEEQQWRVMIFSHVPPRCLAEHDELTEIISASGNVAGFISGHTHTGGEYFFAGVPQLDVKAMLENPDTPTCGFLIIHPDHWEFQGVGNQPDYIAPPSTAKDDEPLPASAGNAPPEVTNGGAGASSK